MLKAKDIMTRDPITISPEAEVTQAAAVLIDKHINGLPVVDKKGRLVGIICQSDLVAQQKKVAIPSVFTVLDSFVPLGFSKSFEKEIKKIAATTVAQAMSSEPVFVEPETSVEYIATLMVEKGFHTIPVVEKGKLVGIVGKEDVLKTLVGGSKTAG